jgi:endoglycosylceramidase
MVRYWGVVAKRFWNNTNIVGFELWNEPWCGNALENPELLIPGVADRKYLQPMYDKGAMSIRATGDRY